MWAVAVAVSVCTWLDISAVDCVKLSGIGFSVDGKAQSHVAALNRCQSFHESGNKQSLRRDDKHE